jgi:hypothetical protein
MHENFKLFVTFYPRLLLFYKDTVKSPESRQNAAAARSLTPKWHGCTSTPISGATTRADF